MPKLLVRTAPAATLHSVPALLGRHAPEEDPMPVRSYIAGHHPDGRPGGAFVLTDGAGLTAKVLEYGATLTELLVPDTKGRSADVVLGFASLQGYLATKTYFGATVGRYANRIKAGRFELSGTAYVLARNDGANHLHGGRLGFDKAVWRGEIDEAQNRLRLEHRSPDGDEGYPGAVEAAVEYRLPGDGRMRIEMTATADRPTILNLVNHSYFNLAGHGSGDVLAQLVMLDAEHYTPVDAELIPTGEILPVRGTAFDFTQPKPIGQDMALLAKTGGYDHNWVLRDASPGAMRLCCRAVDPGSGRGLELWTTEPGVQFYTAGQLNGSEVGKDGHRYGRHAGFTLETQKFPDSPHHPNFPSARLDPGVTYRHVMEYRFFAE
jgi:aldose 1-epimerase